MVKIFFLTFGGPTQNYHEAVERLCKQAKKFEIFDEIIGLTEKDLQNDNEFWSKHKDFINSNSRGYGYWIWKPFIIKKTLEKMNDNDILLFLDCGCELNYLAKNKFLEYLELVKTKKIMGTKPSSSDYDYTKMDLIKFMNMEKNIEELKKKQMQSGVVLMLKCDDIVNLYNENYDICSNNYNLIDDSSSIEKNFDEFKENRHDQSVLSLLVKKYNLINYDLDPTDWGYYNSCNNYRVKQKYLKYGIEYPIWTCRNKSGKSIID